MVTAKLEKDRGEETAFRSWGLTAMEITRFCSREHRLDNTDGVLVTGVRQGGSAMLAKPPLQSNDVIKAVGGQPVKNLAEFIEHYESIMDKDPLPEYVLIEFVRKGGNKLTLIKPKPQEDRNPPPELAKSWIGVAVQPVLKELATRLGAKEHIGFRITQIYPRTLAAQADLKIGDLITHLNGKRLKPRRVEDSGMFRRAVKRLDIGKEARLTLVRDGNEAEVAIQLERTRITPDEAPRHRSRDFELTVREVTFFDRVDNRWKRDVQGVIVVHVEAAGWAGLGGLLPGDLIQRIDDYQITDLVAHREAMEHILKREPVRVVFYLIRGVRTRFQYVEPEWDVVKNN